MASSATAAPHAFVAEIARYLAMEPADVQRMVELDRLPALRLPREKRHVLRIPLRDFHRWLCARAVTPTPALATYETFLADFDASARAPRRKAA
jgi:hypothetical protein